MVKRAQTVSEYPIGTSGILFLFDQSLNQIFEKDQEKLKNFDN
jgi:hypothetical protein